MLTKQDKCEHRLASHLEPTFRHEEVEFNTVFSKLLSHIEAHGAIFIIDLPLILIIKDRIGIVDLLEALSSLRIVWILVGMIPKCKFSAKDKRFQILEGRPHHFIFMWRTKLKQEDMMHILLYYLYAFFISSSDAPFCKPNI